MNVVIKLKNINNIKIINRNHELLLLLKIEAYLIIHYNCAYWYYVISLKRFRTCEIVE